MRQPACLHLLKRFAVVGVFIIGSQRTGLGKQAQVDAATHRFVAFGVQVKPVVLEKELRLHGYVVLRIAHGLVEVDHAIEHLRGANPVVDGAAPFLVVFRVVIVALERRDGGAEHIDALLMCFANDLLIDVDDALGRLHAVTGVAKVVDSLEEDDPLHAFLFQQIALIAVHCGGAQTSSEHTVTSDTHVEYTHQTRFLRMIIVIPYFRIMLTYL